MNARAFLLLLVGLANSSGTAMPSTGPTRTPVTSTPTRTPSTSAPASTPPTTSPTIIQLDREVDLSVIARNGHTLFQKQGSWEHTIYVNGTCTKPKVTFSIFQLDNDDPAVEAIVFSLGQTDIFTCTATRSCSKRWQTCLEGYDITPDLGKNAIIDERITFTATVGPFAEQCSYSPPGDNRVFYSYTEVQLTCGGTKGPSSSPTTSAPTPYTNRSVMDLTPRIATETSDGVLVRCSQPGCTGYASIEIIPLCKFASVRLTYVDSSPDNVSDPNYLAVTMWDERNFTSTIYCPAIMAWPSVKNVEKVCTFPTFQHLSPLNLTHFPKLFIRATNKYNYTHLGYYVFVKAKLACADSDPQFNPTTSPTPRPTVAKLGLGISLALGVGAPCGIGLIILIIYLAKEHRSQSEYLRAAKKLKGNDMKTIREERNFLESNFSANEIQGKLDVVQVGCCEGLASAGKEHLGLKSRSLQLIRVVFGVSVSFLDVYSDITLYVTWLIIGLWEWTAIGFFFTAASSVRGGLLLKHESVREQVRSGKNPDSVLCLSYAWFTLGFIDLGGLKYLWEARNLPEFSYDLAYRFYQYKSTELIESIPAACLGLYVLIGRTMFPTGEGFKDISFSSPLVWIQLVTSLQALSNGIKNDIIHGSPDRTKFEALMNLGVVYSVLIQVFVVTEFGHRAVTFCLVFHFVRPLSFGIKSLIFVAIGLFVALYTAVVALIQTVYDDRFYKYNKKRGIKYCTNDVLESFFFNLITGLLELIVPIWTHKACFEITRDNHGYHGTRIRGVLFVRWIASGAILFAAFLLQKDYPLLHIWFKVACGCGATSVVIYTVSYYVLHPRYRAHYESNNYTAHCPGCYGELDGAIIFDTRVLRTIEEGTEAGLKCTSCRKKSHVFDTIFYCLKGLKHNSHVFFMCPVCLVENQKTAQDTDRILQEIDLNCLCGNPLNDKLNVAIDAKCCAAKFTERDCFKCHQRVVEDGRYFHCKHDSEKHPKGYNLCLSCARDYAYHKNAPGNRARLYSFRNMSDEADDENSEQAMEQEEYEREIQAIAHRQFTDPLPGKSPSIEAVRSASEAIDFNDVYQRENGAKLNKQPEAIELPPPKRLI